MYLLILIDVLLQNVLEQGLDFWCWFDKTQFSYHCVHPIHAKMFSIQMLLHFSQIVPRVCTLVLFILSVFIYFSNLYIDYFIGLDFLGNNFNINVVIIICISPPGANFLGELWSCDIGTLS